MNILYVCMSTCYSAPSRFLLRGAPDYSADTESEFHAEAHEQLRVKDLARLPRFSHISTFMTENLHWLPLIARIRFKILFLTSRVLLGLAPRYLCDSIRRPLSAASGRSLRSLDRHDLLVPRSRTATAQHRAYASVGPMLWNDLPSTIRSVIVTAGISASSRCLKTFRFSQSASDWVLL